MTQITIAYGDGIGPEIMEATLLIMREAGAAFEIEILQMGEEEYRLGAPNGYDKRTLRSIQRTGVLLKAPTINPALIPELIDDEEINHEVFQTVSSALYGELGLHNQVSTSIFTNEPAYTAIISIAEKDKPNLAIFETALAYDSTPANPVGMIYAAVKMLQHMNENVIAARIQNALLKTLEAGANPENCDKFADAVIENLEFA